MEEGAEKSVRALPYYKWFWQEWRANRAVQRMGYVERGLYRELLDECWSEGGIPNDVAEMAEICGCPVDVMANAWQVLSKRFELSPNGMLVNERLERERTDKDRVRLARAEAGRKGGKAKAAKEHAPEPPVQQASPGNGQANASNSHIEEYQERREEGEESTGEQNHPAGDAPKPRKPRRPKEKPEPTAEDESAYQAAARATWNAYRAAYHARYGVDPVRNAKVNAHLKQFIGRIGYDDSPAVAAFFLTVTEPFITKRCHSVADLLVQCEAYRMQWAANYRVSDVGARQQDRTSGNANAADGAKEKLRAMQNANA